MINGHTYWLSVRPVVDDTNFVFGWTTCSTNWNNSMAFGSFASGTLNWQDVRRPSSNIDNLDLAFELDRLPYPNPDPYPGWLQIPDTSSNGLAVRATSPNLLADDFHYTAPLEQIRIWGSWLNDRLPPTLPGFEIIIWDDVPLSAVALSWNSIPYSTNTVFFKSSVTDTSWHVLTSFVLGATGGRQGVVVDPRDASSRFYRVRVDAAAP
jgi:hypothetical protein